MPLPAQPLEPTLEQRYQGPSASICQFQKPSPLGAGVGRGAGGRLLAAGLVSPNIPAYLSGMGTHNRLICLQKFPKPRLHSGLLTSASLRGEDLNIYSPLRRFHCATQAEDQGCGSLQLSGPLSSDRIGFELQLCSFTECDLSQHSEPP